MVHSFSFMRVNDFTTTLFQKYFVEYLGLNGKVQRAIDCSSIPELAKDNRNILLIFTVFQ